MTLLPYFVTPLPYVISLECDIIMLMSLGYILMTLCYDVIHTL